MAHTHTHDPSCPYDTSEALFKSLWVACWICPHSTSTHFVCFSTICLFYVGLYIQLMRICCVSHLIRFYSACVTHRYISFARRRQFYNNFRALRWKQFPHKFNRIQQYTTGSYYYVFYLGLWSAAHVLFPPCPPWRFGISRIFSGLLEAFIEHVYACVLLAWYESLQMSRPLYARLTSCSLCMNYATNGGKRKNKRRQIAVQM